MNDKNDSPPLSDVLAEAEAAMKRLDTPLDTSLDGLSNALVYYWGIHRNMETTLGILEGIKGLLSQGRPLIFGQEKWDNQMVKLLELLNVQKEVIFGESIGESIYNVPGGCKHVWFNYVKIFYESEKLTVNLLNFIRGNDKNGLTKAFSEIGSIYSYVNQLAKERDDLLTIIFHSGFDADTVNNRAKQIAQSPKGT